MFINIHPLKQPNRKITLLIKLTRDNGEGVRRLGGGGEGNAYLKSFHLFLRKIVFQSRVNGKFLEDKQRYQRNRGYSAVRSLADITLINITLFFIFFDEMLLNII